MIRNRLSVCFFLLFTAWLMTAAGCGRTGAAETEASYQSTQVFTMGAVFEIRVYGEEARDTILNIESELYGCEDLISWREEGSLADQFNSQHEADMSAIQDVIEDALRVSHDSQGAFDLTVLPLSELWNFDKMSDSEFDISEMSVPASEDIQTALESVDYRQLIYDSGTAMLSTENDSLKIELGAIGKGYAINQAGEVLRASGASGGMISAGSSIYVYGTKEDGSSFRVALNDPRGENGESLGVLNITDCTVSTSGDYERYFEQDGVRYHHILDPRTGYPADSGLMQVSIICEDGVLGDALSTACFVLGLDEGMALVNQYNVLAIFVDTDKNIWYNNSDVLDMLEFNDANSGYVLCEYN